MKEKYIFVSLRIGFLFCFLTVVAFTSEQILPTESGVLLKVTEHNADVPLPLRDKELSPEQLYHQAKDLRKVKKGEKPNLAKALELYRKSADLGYVKAQTVIAELYMFHSEFICQNVIAISKDEGIRYLKMAANQGSIKAINILINGEYINGEEAINYLKFVDDKGNIDKAVQTLLDKKEYLLNEKVVNRNDVVPLLKLVSAKGDVKAIVQLGEMKAISRDEKISLLKSAADHNENNRDAALAELRKMGICHRPSPTKLTQQNPKQELKDTGAKYNEANEFANHEMVLDAEYADKFVSISSSASSSPDALKRKEPSSSTTLQDNLGKKPRYELEQQYENHELCKVSHIQGYQNHKNLLKEMIKKATRFIYISSYSANFVYDRLLEQAAKRICENKQYEEKDKGIFIDITLSPCDMEYPRSDKIQRIKNKIEIINKKYPNTISCKTVAHDYSSGFCPNHAKLVIVDDLHFIIGSHNWLVSDNNYFENNDCSIHISHNENSKTNQVKTLKESYFQKTPIRLQVDNYSYLDMLYTEAHHACFLWNICRHATDKIEIYSPFVDGKWEDDDKGIVNLCAVRLASIYDGLRVNNAFKVNNKKPKLHIYVQNENDRYLLLCYSSTCEFRNSFPEWDLIDKTIEIRKVNPFHRKSIIVDDSIICEGSFNWFSSSDHNQEASIVIQGNRAQEIINSLRSG